MPKRMDKYDAAIADIISAKSAVERALKRLQSAEPLGKTARVLNPRRRLLEVLPEIQSDLWKCEEEYSAMLEGALIEGDRASGTR